MIKERAHLLYGPPASGKSTIAQNTSIENDLEYLSVGEITRKEIADDTEKGRQLKHYLDNDIVYPLPLITELVEEKIVDAIESERNFLLDGFPKYPWEAEAFLKLMEKHCFEIDTVVIVELPFEEALIRVSNRRICDSCLTQTEVKDEEHSCSDCGGHLIVREDDTPEFLQRRYEDFESSIEQTLEILDGHYNRLVRVDGNRERVIVVEEVKGVIYKPE